MSDDLVKRLQKGVVSRGDHSKWEIDEADATMGEAAEAIERLTKERDDAFAEGASQMRERAAQVAHGNGIYSHSFIGEEVPDDVFTNNNLCWIIRNDIRALPLEESK